MPKPQHILIALLILIGAAYLSGLLTTNQQTRVTGFTYVIPYGSGIELTTKGTFEAGFMNGRGTTINIRETRLINKENLKPLCRETLDKYVLSGERFNVQLSGCGEWGKQKRYEIMIEIDYDYTADGVTHSDTEFGTIAGPITPVE